MTHEMRSVLLLLFLTTVWSVIGGNVQSRDLPIQPSCEVARKETILPRISTERNSQELTLRVKLTWRRRQRHLTLFQNDVAAKNLVMLYDDEGDDGDNDTVAETGASRCYYQGFLKEDGGSYAAVSACGGLEGYIQTSDELLFIEPSSNVPAKGGVFGWNLHPHVIYTCRQSEPLSGNFSDYGEPVGFLPRADPRPRRRRRRRSPGRKRFLEVMVVADHTVVRMHGKDRIKNYLLTLMNIANSVYQHHTLGLNIRVVVTEIVLLKADEQKRVFVKHNAYGTVQQFCQWVAYRQPYGVSAKHDIAVLLTRDKMGPAGYAPVTGLCQPSRACAAITDEGFTSGFIIAHEMAHVFGLFHDGHMNHCTGRNYMTAIMAPLVEAKLNRFWWSECSKQHMQHLIPYLFCLNDDPDMVSDVDHYELDSGSDLPPDMGQHWSMDFQCRLEFGDHFGLCASFPSDQCHMLWCSHRSSPHHCRTKRGPPAPGTSCGQGWECRNFRCTYVGDRAPIHGSWSSWSSWEHCSADCGVGITRRSRQCNKPRPAYGGKDCEGGSEGWDTCVAEECKSYYDPREAHCAVWNDMNIRREQHDWKPFPPRKESDLCKQTCISLQTREAITLDVEVSDGTPCDYDHPTNICFRGNCLVVGCGGVQNSSKTYDNCGICGGDNSQCKNVSGTFDRSPANRDEYESIVFLPKGSRNIKVVKKGNTRHFIALKHVDYGTYALNGDKRQQSSRVFIFVGARFEFKTKPGLQSLVTRGPVHANLEVMLYPNKDTRKASVTYNYTIHKSDVTLEKRKYKWRFLEWSDCSVTCGEGVTTIVHACYDKDTGERVEDDKCQFLDPPRKDEASCTREPCSQSKYIWALTNEWSECDAEGCGEEGEQRQGYECQLYFMNNDTYLENVSLELCDQSNIPEETRHCQTPPCPALNWTIGEWSQCSVTCGKGRQSRRVYCGDPDTDSDDIQCKDTPPALSKPCKLKQCKDSPVGDECQDKYSFCSRANGLSLKCQSKRFAQICCKSCQTVQGSSARSARRSQWTKYRLRRLQRQRQRRRQKRRNN